MLPLLSRIPILCLLLLTGYSNDSVANVLCTESVPLLLVFSSHMVSDPGPVIDTLSPPPDSNARRKSDFTGIASIGIGGGDAIWGLAGSMVCFWRLDSVWVGAGWFSVASYGADDERPDFVSDWRFAIGLGSFVASPGKVILGTGVAVVRARLPRTGVRVWTAGAVADALYTVEHAGLFSYGVHVSGNLNPYGLFGAAMVSVIIH